MTCAGVCGQSLALQVQPLTLSRAQPECAESRVRIQVRNAATGSVYFDRDFDINGTSQNGSQPCGVNVDAEPLPAGLPLVVRVTADNSYLYLSSPVSLQAGETRQMKVAVTAKVKGWPIWTWIQYVLSALSVALVIAGLFKEQIHRLFWHPKLYLKTADAAPYSHEGTYSPPHGQVRPGTSEPIKTVHFCRIWVENGGNAEVTGVEVFVKRVWNLHWSGKDYGPPVEDSKFLPHNLRWSNTWDFSDRPRWLSDPGLLVRGRISEGVGRFVDLGFILPARELDEYFRAIGDNDATVTKNDPRPGAPQLNFAFERLNRNERVQCAYLELILDADGIRAMPYYVRFESTGWNAGDVPAFTLACADPKFLEQVVSKATGGREGGAGNA